jgi:high-affinity Fe2+/Pb2+ permease
MAGVYAGKVVIVGMMGDGQHLKLKAAIALILSLSLVLLLAYSPNGSKTSLAPFVLTLVFLFAFLPVETSAGHCEETQLFSRRTGSRTQLFQRPPPYLPV